MSQNTVKTIELSPALFSSERERFERTCEQLQAFSELSDVWNGVTRLYSEMSVGCKVQGTDAYIAELHNRFAAAFMTAYPSVEFMQDVLLQGGIDAMREAAVKESARHPSPASEPAPKVEPYVPHKAPANWRMNPSMLTWQDVGSMESEEREQALKVMGYDDAGEDTEEAIYESVNRWLTRLTTMSTNPLRAGSNLLLFMRLIFVQEMERCEREAAESKPKAKAKAKSRK